MLRQLDSYIYIQAGDDVVLVPERSDAAPIRMVASALGPLTIQDMLEYLQGLVDVGVERDTPLTVLISGLDEEPIESVSLEGGGAVCPFIAINTTQP